MGMKKWVYVKPHGEEPRWTVQVRDDARGVGGDGKKMNPRDSWEENVTVSSGGGDVRGKGTAGAKEGLQVSSLKSE